MNTENINIVEKIDEAFKDATAPAQTSPDSALRWATPEDYTKETGRRFRVTNEEITKFGNPKEVATARQAAFEERQRLGTLV